MRVHSHFPSEARTLRNTNTDTQPPSPFRPPDPTLDIEIHLLHL